MSLESMKMASSTPQRRSRITEQCSSPSVSSIEVSSIREPSTSSETANGDVFESLSECSYNTSIFLDEEHIDFRRFKRSGRHWDLLKPLFKGTLYDCIITNPKDVKVLAFDFLKRFSEYPTKVLSMLFQLFIDVCGYQNIDIDEFYKFQERNMEEIILSLEASPKDPEIASSNLCLFENINGNTVDFIKLSLFSFLESLIAVAHLQDVLYDTTFSTHVFEMLRCMSFSMHKNIRYTGIIFSLKFMTSCCILYENVCEQMQNVPDASETFDKLSSQKTILLKYMNYLFLIYHKNYLLPDHTSFHIRAACAAELRKWILHVPKYIIEDKCCYKSLMRLLLDESRLVRRSAIESCKKLVKTKENVVLMRSDIKIVIEVVFMRVYDVDYEVAIAACDILTQLTKNSSKYIHSAMVSGILLLMYHGNFQLAKSAAAFIIQILRMQSAEPAFLIKKLAQTNLMDKVATQTRALVETLIEVPEMNDWHLMLNIIIKNKSPDLKKSLLNMFRVTLEVLLKKDVTNVNGKPRREIVVSTEEVNQTAAEIFLNYVDKLFIVFNGENDAIEDILKIVLIIQFKELRKNYEKEYTVILKEITDLFLRTSDEKLLALIPEILCQFYEKVNKNLTQPFVNNIIGNVTNKFEEEKNLWILTNENLETMRVTSLKLSTFIEHFDLTNVVNWSDIFQFLSFDRPEVTINLLTCCKWHLIWQVRGLISQGPAVTNQLESDIASFIKIYQRYINVCRNIIENSDQLGIALRLAAFENVCDITIKLDVSLETPIKFSYHFKQIPFRIEHSEFQKTMLDFLEIEIIKSPNLSLERRRENVTQIVRAMLAGVLPMVMCHRILRYYVSHFYEFGHIISHFICKIKEVECLEAVIVFTLKKLLLEILEKRNVFDITSGQVKELCVLAKKLSSCYEVKSREAERIIQLGFRIVFGGQGLLDYLHFLKIFIYRLNAPELANISRLFTEKVPPERKRDDAVLSFSLEMKNANKKKKQKGETVTTPSKKKKSGGKKKLRQKSTTTTTTTTPNEEMSIQESDSEVEEDVVITE